QLPAALVINAEHPHRRQSDEHARRVHLHRGSPELDDLRQPSSSQSPCAASGMPYTPLISEAPVELEAESRSSFAGRKWEAPATLFSVGHVGATKRVCPTNEGR